MKVSQTLTYDYAYNISMLDEALKLNNSFDIVCKKLIIAGQEASLYFIDGLIKDDILEKMLEFVLLIKESELATATNSQLFCDKFVPYVETQSEKELAKITTQVLSGTLALCVGGYNCAIMIDARTYPTRGVTEPDDDRVLRGSRDGFVETLVSNTALIRRRIRAPDLSMQILQVGDESKTDIVLCYLENKVDKKFLTALKEKIKAINVNTLTLNQESLAECLMRQQWYNPFPKIRYTERPDAASASIAEGKIIVIIDNSPAVMILPTGFFDFLQDTNDYYFPPVVGTYLRLIRICVFFLTLFLTPTWYTLIQNPGFIPPWLDFIKVSEPNSVPIIFQLLLIEFVIDALKLASLNTPSVLSSSFSVVGALILGDFAVKARWFVPEVVLYMAFVAISNFTQPSFELGYALKLSRVFLLLSIAIFNIWGFACATLIIAIILCTTPTISGRSYLYPLLPFHAKEFFKLFIRVPISKSNT